MSMVKELESIELFKGVFDKLEQNKDRYAKSKWLNNGHARVNSRRGKAKSDASTSPSNLVTTSIVNGDINVEAIEFTMQRGASIYEVNAESELLKGPIGDEGESGEKGEPGAVDTHTSTSSIDIVGSFDVFQYTITRLEIVVTQYTIHQSASQTLAIAIATLSVE